MATQGSNDTIEKIQVLLHQQRQRLYPTLYNEKSNVPQILNHFAVDYFLYDQVVDERAVEAAASKKLKQQHHQQQPESEIDVEATLANTDCSSTNDVPDTTSNQPENEITAVPPLDMMTMIRSTGSRSVVFPKNDTTDVSSPPPPEKPTVPLSSSSSSRDIWGRVPPKEYIPTATTSNNHNTTTTSSSSISGMGCSTSSSSEPVVVATCMMICSICQQKVGSSLRYASHLDKCLGIGTMSRNTNSSASSTLQNSGNTSSYLHS